MSGRITPPSRVEHIQKRRLKELEGIERWLCRGRGGLSIENIEMMPVVIDFFLRAFGLKKRGERNAADIYIKEIVWEFETLPEEFSGYQILHLSDIHIDGLWELHGSIISALAGIEADLCVMTGDFRFSTSGETHLVVELMEKVAPKINTRDGIIAILGNHDSVELVEPLEKMGIKFLLNENVVIQRAQSSIAVSGLDDLHYYDMADMQRCTDCMTGSEAFRILLVHSPEIISEAEESGYDFYLCGHTHGGQICLPGIGAVITNANCKREFVAGEWTYKSMKGYTHYGTGSSCLPVRFNCRPEIVVHKLVRL